MFLLNPSFHHFQNYYSLKTVYLYPLEFFHQKSLHHQVFNQEGNKDFKNQHIYMKICEIMRKTALQLNIGFFNYFKHLIYFITLQKQSSFIPIFFKLEFLRKRFLDFLQLMPFQSNLMILLFALNYQNILLPERLLLLLLINLMNQIIPKDIIYYQHKPVKNILHSINAFTQIITKLF